MLSQSKNQFRKGCEVQLPKYFNKELILSKLDCMDTQSEFLIFILEIELAAIFAAKIIHKLSPGPALVSDQFKSKIQLCERSKLDAEIIRNRLLFINAASHRFARHVVTTYLDCASLALIITNLIKATPVNVNQYRKLLIDSLDNLFWLEDARDIKIAELSQLIFPEWNPFLRNVFFLQSYIFNDSFNYKMSILLPAVKIENQLKLIGSTEPILALPKCESMLQDILFTLENLYKTFLSDQDIPEKLDITNDMNKEDFNRSIEQYFEQESITKITESIESMRSNPHMLRSFLCQLEERLKYLIDTVTFQLDMLKADQSVNKMMLLLDIYTEILVSQEKPSPASVQKRSTPLIDYTVKDKAAALKQHKKMDNFLKSKLRICHENESADTLFYYSTNYDLVCVEKNLIINSILNSKLSLNFFNNQIIEEQLTQSPRGITQLLHNLLLVSLFFTKMFDRLSGGLVPEILRKTTLEPQLIGFYLLYDKYAPARPLISTFFEKNPHQTQQKTILTKYINFDLLLDYLNDLVINQPLPKVLQNLTSLYLDAYNISAQISILGSTESDKGLSTCLYIYKNEIAGRIAQIKPRIENKAWHDLIIPPPDEILPSLLKFYTKPPAVKKVKKVVTVAAAESKESAHITPENKEIPAAPLALATVPTAKKFKTPPAQPPLSQPTQPAVMTVEEKIRIAQYAFMGFKTQLKDLDSTIINYRNDFKKSIADYDKSKSTLKKLNADINEEIPFLRRGLNNLISNWFIDKENYETARAQLNILNVNISDIKAALKEFKKGLAQELFLLERDRKLSATEEKPRWEKEVKTFPRNKRSKRISLPAKTPSHQLVTALKPKLNLDPLQAKFKERAVLRIQHLNQACKNLVYISKILLVNKANFLSAEITHFSLLYNIFRCFQSLKMYQACGGYKELLDHDFVIDLRNMLIHHGARSADSGEVIEFASALIGELPEIIVNIQKKNVISYELKKEERQQLISEFGLADNAASLNLRNNHDSLIFDNAPLYRSLIQFHEARTENANEQNILKELKNVHLPAIKRIAVPLFTKDGGFQSDLFFDAFLFELQALRMLVAICGELSDPAFDDKYAMFFKYCRTEVRNPVGHELSDMDSYSSYRDFSASLKDQLVSLNKKSNPAAFFNQQRANPITIDNEMKTPALQK